MEIQNREHGRIGWLVRPVEPLARKRLSEIEVTVRRATKADRTKQRPIRCRAERIGAYHIPPKLPGCPITFTPGTGLRSTGAITWSMAGELVAAPRPFVTTTV